MEKKEALNFEIKKIDKRTGARLGVFASASWRCRDTSIYACWYTSYSKGNDTRRIKRNGK